MPVTPTGPFSLPLYGLRRLMAASTTWQSWTGAAATTDPAGNAAKRIHYFDKPPPFDHQQYTAVELEALRPCAVLGLGDPMALVRPSSSGMNEYHRIAGGSRLTFVDRGTIYLSIEADVPSLQLADGESTDAMMELLNRAGAVYAEMLALSGTNDYFVLQSMQFADPMRAAHEEKTVQGDYISMLWRVEWGNFA